MLNWLSKEFLLAVIISLIITVVVLSWGGPPGPYEQSPGNDQQSKFQIECTPNCFVKRVNSVSKGGGFSGLVNKLFEEPIIGLTGGILIANFLLVIAVLGQIKEARDSSEARLRAYVVCVVGSQFRQGATRGFKFEFRPVMLNTGQTPAYDVRSVARIGFMSFQEALKFDFELPDLPGGSVMTLGPRQDRFVHVIFERQLSRNELRQYRRLEKSLFVYGTTRYRDAFGKPRYTNFCYSVAWWNKRGAPLWHSVAQRNDSN